VHLYIHVPFCARRCSYCDFSIAVRRVVPSVEFADAIIREWTTWQTHPVWQVSPLIETIYFGGGTPSRLEPSAIQLLLDGIRARRPVAADAEITLEANPDDITADAAARWREAGVNRVSLGVQSFDPHVLAWMHRTHTAEQSRTAVATLRSAGIGNVSLDLIFALPPALGGDWLRDLDEAFALAPDHLSLYGLTVESHTPLARWRDRGDVRLGDDDAYAAEFLAAAERFEREGWDHYEVSNAARPGFRSRHNSAYWRRAPYIGLGPSAHSGFGLHRSWNVREWEAWRLRARGGEALIEGAEELAPDAVAVEDLYLGLRTSEGVPEHALDPEQAGTWIAEGWAFAQGGRVRLTPEGWLRLDALVGAAK
jgi:oxygen-independent coproporphyrinogen-3 oxidase